jgi:hypothetical protein
MVVGGGVSLSDDLVREFCRFGASEIHNVAAIIGGIASQEAIKVLNRVAFSLCLLLYSHRHNLISAAYYKAVYTTSGCVDLQWTRFDHINFASRQLLVSSV